jgi:DNA primase
LSDRDRVTQAARHPGELTTEGRIANRHGRLYLDTGRNGYAQTMAAPRRPVTVRMVAPWLLACSCPV